LKVIENEAEALIRRECEVCIDDDMYLNLQRVFEESKAEEFKDRETTALETFFTCIVEDPWFDEEDRIETVVR